MRNDIKLYSWIDARLVSHFNLREFEARNGFCMVDSDMVQALEFVHRDLALETGKEISIGITGCIRTQEENEALAARLGWTDQGGAVARDTKHLPKYGGIAVDFKAYFKGENKSIDQKIVGSIARRYFTYVNDSYSDGHVHADMRKV